MDDLISRQAAINAIDECYCGGEDSCGEPWIYKENAVEAIQMIERLPSAQPYTEAEIQKMQELEQAELQKAYECGRASAQPEIIRCCKCVYWQQNTIRQNSNDAGWWNEALCEKHTIYGNEPHEAWVDADWYCGDAERRTDE